MAIILLNKRRVVTLKKYFSTFFPTICLLLLVMCTGITLDESPGTIYGKVLRLHVLANSDSAEDQQIKLMVRDRLLEVTQGLFYDCRNVNQAVNLANENAHLIEEAARQVLEENDRDGKVSVVIGKENYPEKEYGSMSFPEGEYLSVRVLLGEGRGRNWWCVLFPPLCNAGIEDSGKIMSSYGIDEKEIEELEKEMKDGGIDIFGCNVRLKIFDYFKGRR